MNCYRFCNNRNFINTFLIMHFIIETVEGFFIFYENFSKNIILKKGGKKHND